ncbi:hypothetical protein [Marinobacterium sp. BA1]|uniref:hypothetical protein n=1 Tax=Marinobacterium sp. BA1 TaxID=3138931 RepID=UPI0032E59660
MMALSTAEQGNNKLSAYLRTAAFLVHIIGIIGMMVVWFGKVPITPADLFAQALFGEATYSLKLLSLDLSEAARGMSIPLCTALVSMVLLRLSQRAIYGSWAELRTAEEADRAKSIKSCGLAESVEIIDGGLLGSDKVVIQTNEQVLVCYGSVSCVEKGSPVKRQFNEVIVIDNGRKKRLRLA